MTMKINKLEIENVKRIRAVKIEPTQNGLTVIGGNNNQGKTSVLDSIAWALGGENFRPTEAMRHMELELGDIIGGREQVTGTEVKKPIVRKILKIKDGKAEVEYKVKGDE